MVEVSVSVLDVKEEDAVSKFYNVETAKIDYFHIDVMDGKFVEKDNLEQMMDYALKLRTVSMTPLDVHLMVQNPKEVIENFIVQSPDRITFHLEACSDSDEVLDLIKCLIENGVKASIAVSPDTDIERVYEFLPYVHMVLVMTVVPGKGGQVLIPECLEKVRKLKKFNDDNDLDIDIEVDGGINDVTAKEAIEAGANVLVAGKYIWSASDYREAVSSLRNSV